MEKESIFKQLDNLYTKAVKVIIAEDSEESATPEISTKKKTTSAPTTKMKTLKKTVSNMKHTLLNIGTPNEKEILYKEVIKREKLEDKEAAKITKEKAQLLKAASKTKVAPNQKTPTKTNTPTKKSATVPKTETTKKVSPKKTAEKKATAVKKSPAKKTAAVKTTPAKKTTKKSSDVKTTTKKKPTTSGKSPNTKTRTKKVEAKKKASESKAAPRGAKKAAKIALYIKDIKKHYGEVDEEFVVIIVNNLGPSIYKKDAELVTCSDPKELDTVRKNFLMKKLGIDASKGVLDAAIQDVCAELKATPTKYRATFYYVLAKKFKKESVLH